MRAEFDRECAGHRIEGGLAGVVRSDVGQARQSGDRTDVDDPSAGARFDHGAARHPRERGGTEEVGLDDLVPFSQRRVGDGAVERVDTGVVDQSPHVAREFFRGVQGGDHGVGVGDVADHDPARTDEIVDHPVHGVA